MLDARSLALALPEAVEQDHHGFPSFRVRGAIFATTPDVGFVNVMLDPESAEDAAALDPACAPLWWGKKLAGVRVDLTAISEEVLRDLLREAWARKAPARLRRLG